MLTLSPRDGGSNLLKARVEMSSGPESSPNLPITGNIPPFFLLGNVYAQGDSEIGWQSVLQDACMRTHHLIAVVLQRRRKGFSLNAMEMCG